jgi:hypothetical protein
VADPPARSDRSENDDHGTPGMPTWVKVFGGIGLVVVVLFVVLLVFGGGGHGPGRHGGAPSGEHTGPPPGVTHEVP